MTERVDRRGLHAEPEVNRDGEVAPPETGSSGSTSPHRLGEERQRVPVDLLSPGESPRLAGEDEEHVRALAESEASLPPVLVHRRSMRVIDGMHRLRAAHLRGDREVEVRFFDGTVAEAFLQAVRANVTHGLPLAAADREAAAIRIVSEHPGWSDRAISAMTGLATKIIAVARRKLDGSAAGSGVRVGLDGRARPLDSHERRRAASELIERNPDASLREIAKVVGISPTTVRDVRERMRGNGHRPSGDRRTGAGRRESDSQSARVPGVGKEQALQDLRKDPSLRYSESGRAFVRWLIARTQGPADGRELVSKIPPHCAYLAAAAARECASEWLRFAERLEQLAASAG